MPVKLEKRTLENQYFKFNSMVFRPEIPSHTIALFTHGYTASKNDCLNWAQRLSENGITTVIFDLPGHHLGSFNSVGSFQDFKEHAYECFDTAFKFACEINPRVDKVILGGHSLGALLALHATQLRCFSALERIAVCVGIGISQHKATHLFETSFYEKTLNIRRQLVDEHIDADLIFPWIKEAKHNLKLTNTRIHMITGADDVVVGAGGMQALVELLTQQGNNVSSVEPKRLPHHEPSLAATHIFNYLKKELSLN